MKRLLVRIAWKIIERFDEDRYAGSYEDISVGLEEAIFEVDPTDTPFWATVKNRKHPG